MAFTAVLAYELQVDVMRQQVFKQDVDPAGVDSVLEMGIESVFEGSRLFERVRKHLELFVQVALLGYFLFFY